ncbi:MAG: glutamate 5-kinase [Candidatus Woesearchaeota archaeon]|nr:glutamate 5-kinase [Candidatus Woesearchaeota archaeon]
MKVGTNILTKGNGIDTSYIGEIAKQIETLHKDGHQVILVSSGAIGFGCMELKKQPSRDIKMRQAFAAVGQGLLMHEYAQAFNDVHVAQVLVTYDVIEDRKKYLNLRNSIRKLLTLGVIPIVNENDAVAVDEIGSKFGDNDLLSAMVALKSNADALFILTDTTGLYTDNPAKNADARLVRTISEITPAVEGYAGKAGFTHGVGGMKAKINAAKLAIKGGCTMVIANGREEDVLLRLVAGERIGTLFIPKKKLSSKQRWILSGKPKGTIHVNECADDILQKDTVNLLPIGVDNVEGTFKKGDVVMINDFAKAIVEYDAKTINKVKGLESAAAAKILGKKRAEVVKQELMVFI